MIEFSGSPVMPGSAAMRSVAGKRESDVADL